MNTYSQTPLPAGRKPGRKQSRTRSSSSTARKSSRSKKEKDLTKYLTMDYVRRALAVIDHRLARNDARTAKYVLEMYFGKPSTAKSRPEQPSSKRNAAEKKPSIRLTSEFFDKLAQKYFPRPDLDAQQSTSYRAGEKPGEQKPQTGG